MKANAWQKLRLRIFPSGSQTECPGGGECAWEDSVYKDPNYSPYIVLAEAAIFSMLWLVSKAPKPLGKQKRIRIYICIYEKKRYNR